MILNVTFFSVFLNVPFSVWPRSDIFFLTFYNNGSEIKDNKADDGLFRGFYITAQMGEFMEWVWKTKAFFFMRKSSDTHIQLGGVSSILCFLSLFFREEHDPTKPHIHF